MKILLLFIAAACCAASDIQTLFDWETYKMVFNKNYPDPAVDKMHEEIFEQRKIMLVEQNKEYLRGKSTWAAGFTLFTDLTEEEANHHKGLLPPNRTAMK